VSFSTYNDFKTAVANWTHRDNLATYLDDIITVAENRIFREVRARSMEDRSTLNTAISSGVVALPSGYVALKYAYIDGTPVSPLQRKSAEWIMQNYPTRSGGGRPVFIARDGEYFIFGPYPDSTYTVKGTYYKRLTSITGGTLNTLFTDHEDLYLSASIAAAGKFASNLKLMNTWEAEYQRIRNEINGEERAENYSGSPLAMTAA